MEAQPLSQFVILAQTAQGRAVEALVNQALEHPGVFVFGELLDCPNIQALAGTPEGLRLLELLRLFAYGTYPDFVASRANLPELTPAQRRKLQLLTIVSLSGKDAPDDRLIKFSDLQVALDVSSPRELEDLIIDAVYQGLIVGKMDQENQCLEVESSTCRDCREEDIDFIIQTLTSWEESANKILGSLDSMVQYSSSCHEQQRCQREELEKLIQKTRESLKEGGIIEKATGDGGCTRMPTDDADEESKRAKGNRGRRMGGGTGSDKMQFMF